MNSTTCFCVGMSCGPAQLLFPVVAPIFLIAGTIQKIKAVWAEHSDKYLYHIHDPKQYDECAYSADRHMGNHGNGYKACPYDEVKDLHSSAKTSFDIFFVNMLCLIPVAGGLLAGLYIHYNEPKR